jgi:hypothetical protein
MRIRNDGNIGIGTTSPNESLEVAGNIHVSGGDRSIFNRSNNALVFGTNNSERMRLVTTAVLIGGTIPQTGGGIFQIGPDGASNSATTQTIQSFGFDGRLRFRRATAGSPFTAVTSGQALGTVGFDGYDGASFIEAALISAAVDGTPGASDMPGRLVFSTTADGASSPTERMRITSAGVSRFYSVGGNVLQSGSSSAAGTSFNLFLGQHSATSTDTGTVSIAIRTNGNIENTNNSYGAFSDIKLKENIVDASSQWDDLKALQVRNYNFKEGQTHTQIGLVAQEVELVSPGLVTESPDRDEDGNDVGTVTKSVNYSVLYMKAVKALQEAMERIETLEAKVAALEAS